MVSKDADSLAANPNHTHAMVLRSACSAVNCTAGSVCGSHHAHKHSTNFEEVDLSKSHQYRLQDSDLAISGADSVTQVCSSIRTLTKKSTTTFVQTTGSLEEHEKSWNSVRSSSLSNADDKKCQNVNILATNLGTGDISSKSNCLNNTSRNLSFLTTMARTGTLYRKNNQSLSQAFSSEEYTPDFVPSFQETSHYKQDARNYSSSQSYLHEQLVRGDISHRKSRFIEKYRAGNTNNNHGQQYQSRTSGWQFSDKEKDYENSGDESDSTSSRTTTISGTEAEGYLRYLLFWRKYLYFGLSKPTHYDFENLSRISAFGKKKAVLLLLLPLLIWFLVGALRQENTFVHLTKPVVRPFETFYTYMLSFMYMKSKSDDIKNNVLVNNHEKRKDVFKSFWGISSDLISNFIPRDYTFETVPNLPFQYKEKDSIEHVVSVPAPSSPPLTYMSKDEIQSLVTKIIREEIASQISVANHQGRAWTQEEMNKIQTKISTFQSEFTSITDAVKSMQVSNRKLQVSLDAEKLNHQQDEELLQIRTKLDDLENSFNVLNSIFESAKNCCKNQTDFSSVEAYLTSILLSMTDENSNKMNPNLKPFKDWLSSKFMNTKRTSEDLKDMMSLIKNYNESSKVVVMDLVKQHMERVKHELVMDTSKVVHSLEQTGMLSSADVQHMIKEAILLYDADKTGQTDYALESGGGSVVNTRCSETYNERSPQLTIFGIPLWSTSSSPRNAIQPDLHPGQCWAFRGSNGYLVIQLATTIRPTAFVIEHIPKSISPTGDISSAPKDFSVWGLAHEKDAEGKLLGRYTYDIQGEPLQYFPIQEDDGKFYSFVELKIHSNHGEIAYTCLYRFRVHGSRY